MYTWSICLIVEEFGLILTRTIRRSEDIEILRTFSVSCPRPPLVKLSSPRGGIGCIKNCHTNLGAKDQGNTYTELQQKLAPTL